MSMMGQKSVEPKLYYNFSLDAAVPADHFLRRLASAVDFSFVRELTRGFYSHTGKPSVDPEVIFKLSLLGYLFNIASERRLCQEAGLHLAWRWFLGYELDEAIPDHSVLSKARRRFGLAVYERFFRQIVSLCEARGLVEGDVLFVDSTLVDADAAAKSQRSRALQEQKLSRPEKFVAELWAVNDEEEEPPPPRPKKRSGPPRRPDGERGRSQSKTNRMLISTTDPDAEMAKKRGQAPRLRHKVHLGTDGGRAGIVTAVATSPANEGDGHAVKRLLAKHRRGVGRDPRQLAADAGYSSEAAFRACFSRGVEPVINLQSFTNSHGGYDRDQFTYVAERDLFICPQGKELHRIADNFKLRTAVYSPPPGSCQSCVLKAQCAPGHSDRHVTRRWETEMWEAVKEIIHSRRGRKLLGRRQTLSERVFADAKDKHGLDRAQFRGRGKMQIQALLTAATLNLRKLAARHPLPQAGAAAGLVMPSLAPLPAPSSCWRNLTAALEQFRSCVRRLTELGPLGPALSVS
jgi:transposase